MIKADDNIKDYQSYPAYLTSRYTVFLALLGHVGFLVLFIFLQVLPLVYVNIGSCLIFVSAIFFNRLRFHRLVLNLTLIEIISHAYFATYYLGWESAFYLYLFCLIPLVFVYRIISPLNRRVLLGSLLGCLLILYFSSLTWPVMHPLSTVILSNLTLMNLILTFLVFVILYSAYSLSAMDLERQLRLKNEELENSSRIDPLTALSNRRDIIDLIQCEREKMLRNKSHCCFILGDIDFFKRINDSYGHNYGDDTLKQVAVILQGTLRKQDHVCRWGGEEFLIVLPDTDVSGAKVAAEKLRIGIESFSFCSQDISTHITMTFGVAPYDPLLAIEDSIKQADDLLLFGKQQGRNRVES
jgi:diguanylate cyclase (GGDEF)-like protein